MLTVLGKYFIRRLKDAASIKGHGQLPKGVQALHKIRVKHQ